MKLSDIAPELKALRTDVAEIGTLDSDYESGISFTAERTVLCAIHPYNEAALLGEYGGTLKGGLKMYIDADDPIDIGDGVKFDGRLYRAVRADKYKSHKRVTLEYTRVAS